MEIMVNVMEAKRAAIKIKKKLSVIDLDERILNNAKIPRTKDVFRISLLKVVPKETSSSSLEYGIIMEE